MDLVEKHWVSTSENVACFLLYIASWDLFFSTSVASLFDSVVAIVYPALWDLFEKPQSSLCAKLISLLSIGRKILWHSHLRRSCFFLFGYWKRQGLLYWNSEIERKNYQRSCLRKLPANFLWIFELNLSCFLGIFKDSPRKVYC